MRVLVIGGAGFIGSNVVQRLLYRDHTVVIWDTFSQSEAYLQRVKHTNLSVVMFDVNNKRLKSEYNFDAVVVSTRNDESDAIEKSVLSVVLSCIKFSADTKIVLISSLMDLFDGSKYSQTISESVEACPQNLQGVYFHLAEVSLLKMHSNWASIRVSSVFGDKQERHPILRWEEHGVIEEILRCAIEEDILQLSCNIGSLRDYVNVEDVARAVVNMVERERPFNSIVHLTSGVTNTIHRILQSISSQGYPVECVWDDSAPVEHFVCDTSYIARSALGWREHLGLYEYIRDRLRSRETV